jgi:hypothetical protein
MIARAGENVNRKVIKLFWLFGNFRDDPFHGKSRRPTILKESLRGRI